MFSINDYTARFARDSFFVSGNKKAGQIMPGHLNKNLII